MQVKEWWELTSARKRAGDGELPEPVTERYDTYEEVKEEYDRMVKTRSYRRIEADRHTVVEGFLALYDARPL